MCNRYGYLAPISRLIDEFNQVRIPIRFDGAPNVTVEADGALRDHVWREGLSIYPGWAAYQQRARHRDIAIFILA